MNGRCRPTHLLVAGLLSAAFHAGVAPTPTNASQLSFPTSSRSSACRKRIAA